MAIEQTIKQRLIGAIVLVALAVIFLPSILGQKNERKIFTSKVPTIEVTPTEPSNTRKALKLETEEDPTSEILKSSSETAGSTERQSTEEQLVSEQDQVKQKQSPSQVTQNDKREPDESQTTSITEQPVLTRESWVIQVGSFSSHANAELLAKRLEEQGMKSFVRPVDLKDKQLLYRVFVGPWLDKQQADGALPQVTDITRLKPIVVKWQPSQH